MTTHSSSGRQDATPSPSSMLGGSLEDLQAFCSVVELGSISAAARDLSETKGSISRRISRLEGRLGVALLARTPRAVSPTEEGMRFHGRAREALTLLADATEGARSARAAPQGLLRVTAPVDLGVDLLPPLVVEFHRQHPQIRVELVMTDTPLDLTAHRIDMALRAGGHDLPDMNYRASPIADLTISLHASPRYIEEHGLPEHPEDLQQHALVTSLSHQGTAPLILQRRGRRYEIENRAQLRTSDYASLARLLIAGGGIGPLPNLIARGAVERGELIEILPDMLVHDGKLHAITLRGLDAPVRVRLFREFLRESLMG